MSAEYFEQLHRQEARHGEWQLLDESLRQRTSGRLHPLRIMLGRWLLRAGARLAGEPMAWYAQPVCAPVGGDKQEQYN